MTAPIPLEPAAVVAAPAVLPNAVVKPPTPPTPAVLAAVVPAVTTVVENDSIAFFSAAFAAKSTKLPVKLPTAVLVFPITLVVNPNTFVVGPIAATIPTHLIMFFC
ncbi:hypothetical protein SDC9_156794 [bioreactor metagenome]|uniref:Uncharacterized protein n=1 Tax=bioreactor metagenome TaxID=1076179 RepID=A0A645FAB9_9ZZZZ